MRRVGLINPAIAGFFFVGLLFVKKYVIIVAIECSRLAEFKIFRKEIASRWRLVHFMTEENLAKQESAQSTVDDLEVSNLTALEQIRRSVNERKSVMDSITVSDDFKMNLGSVLNEFWTNTIQFLNHVEMEGYHSIGATQRCISALRQANCSTEDYRIIQKKLEELSEIMKSAHKIACAVESSDQRYYNDYYIKSKISIATIIQSLDFFARNRSKR